MADGSFSGAFYAQRTGFLQPRRALPVPGLRQPGVTYRCAKLRPRLRSNGRADYTPGRPSPHLFFSARFSMSSEDRPLVSVIMGSKSDWETLGHTDEMLTRFGVP